MQKEIVVTSGDLQRIGESLFSVGCTMVLLAGIKIYCFGTGFWSILLVVLGSAIICYSFWYSAPGDQAQKKVLNDYYKGK